MKTKPTKPIETAAGGSSPAGQMNINSGAPRKAAAAPGPTAARNNAPGARPQPSVAASQAKAPKRSSTARPGLKVCLLDDSHASSQEIQAALRSNGDSVAHFYSAEDAYRAVTADGYDALVIAQAPDLDASTTEELIRILKTSDRLESLHLPIVVIAGSTDVSNLQALHDAGADEVFFKPLRSDLGDALAVVVSRHKAVPVLEPLGGRLNICLLEDSYSLSQTIATKLAERGHSVDYCALAGEAFEAISRKPYDLLIASQKQDNALECAGLILTLRSAQEEEIRNLPIIVMTASATPDNVKSLTRAGASHVLAKRLDGELNAAIFDVVQTVASGGEVTGSAAPARPADTSPATVPAGNSSLPADTSAWPDPEPFQAEPRRPVKSRRAPRGPDFKVDAPDPSPVAPVAPVLGGRGKTIKAVLGVVAIAAIVLLASLWHHIEEAHVEVVSAREGLLSKSVNAPGRVVTRKQVDLTSPVAGQLAKVYVEEGEKVKKDEVLPCSTIARPW